MRQFPQHGLPDRQRQAGVADDNVFDHSAKKIVARICDQS